MEAAVAANQDEAKNLQQQAIDLFATGKRKEAIALCQEAIKKQPDFAPAYMTLSNFSQILGKLAEALRAYEKALEFGPNLSEAYCNLGIIYRKQEKFDLAIRSYQKAIALNPMLPRSCRGERGEIHLPIL